MTKTTSEQGGAAPGLRLAVYGSGRLATELLHQIPHTRHRVVLGIVHSPHRAGHDLGDLTIGRHLDLPTTADLPAALDRVEVDLLLYTGLLGETHQRVLEQCAETGVDVIHTSFVHPRIGLPAEVTEQLTGAAGTSGARLLGTGLLPGLVLDVMPALLATALPDPVTIVGRVGSDLSTWGKEVLREELGVGRTENGTAWRYEAVMRESAEQLIDALGLDRVELRSEGGLRLAEAPVQVGPLAVEAGQIEGFEQRVIGADGDDTVLDLSWIAVPDARARGVHLGLELELTGGDGASTRVRLQGPPDPYPGTAARMLKAIGPLRRMEPGIHLPASLAIA